MQAERDPGKKRSKWPKWTTRLIAYLVAVFIGFVAVSSCGSLDSAAPRRVRSDRVLPDDAWPGREPSRSVDITGSGKLPSDQGVFGQCRIFSLGPDVEDTTAEHLMLIAKASSGDRGELTGVFEGKGLATSSSSNFKVKLDGQNLLFAQVLPTGRKANGVLLFLGSIDALSSGERQALQVARDRGWNVVACTIGIDSTASENVTVSDNGAARLASRIDEHLCDRAYALEAMIKYLEVKRPDLLVGRRVVVGMSAGAIALPTAVARIGPVDAAVLIGGGENVARIVTNSPLLSGHTELVETVVDSSDPKHLVISKAACKDPNKRRKFVEQVLQESKLDPHHTASVLRGTPVLMLHAEYDRIVHAETGRALYESLQRPERWRYRTGHIGLTAIIPWKIGYVLDWVERNALARPAWNADCV